jgi:hypothetical protein
MKKLFQNTAFNIGLWSSLTLFVALNFLSYVSAIYEYNIRQTQEIRLSASSYMFGFPFPIYVVSIGNPNAEHLHWESIVVNTLITVICSFVVGLIFKSAWSKIRNSPLA